MHIGLKVVAIATAVTSSLAYADQISVDDVRDAVDVPECRQVRAIEPANPRGVELLYSNSLDPADPYKRTRVGNQCAINGDAADLQTALGLTILGVGCQADANNALADDFTLAQGAVIQELVFYLYQTGATVPTINRLDYAILTASPQGQSQPTWITVLNPTVTLTNVFRKSSTDSDAVGCTRRFQRVSISLDSTVALPPGQYWLAWRAAGTLASGPWHSAVVFPGQASKPGANGLQSAVGGAFEPYNDSVPQDFIFEIYGSPSQVGACCDLAARTCTDFVLPLDCQGPFKRYHPNLTCASLDPPCNRVGVVSYQGHLTSDSAPVHGIANLRFSLFDAPTGGAPIGAASTTTGVLVTEGLLTAHPAFDSAAFSGQLRWLQVEVEHPVGSGFVALDERQLISLAPMALYADYAAYAEGLIDDLPWSQISGVPAGFADGIDDVGLGDITAVSAGAGLTGGGTSGAVNVAVNSPATA